MKAIVQDVAGERLFEMICDQVPDVGDRISKRGARRGQLRIIGRTWVWEWETGRVDTALLTVDEGI